MRNRRSCWGQIKPHFIFNALANIKALIYTDPDLAEKLIIAFTKYLRTHLNALGKEEMARFPDILDFVDNYPGGTEPLSRKDQSGL